MIKTKKIYYSQNGKFVSVKPFVREFNSDKDLNKFRVRLRNFVKNFCKQEIIITFEHDKLN